LVEKTSESRLVSTNLFIKTPTNQPSRALRNHHQQMIQKAQEALEGQIISKRDITGTTVAIKPEQLELAKREIQKFHKRLADLLDTADSGDASEVYQLNIQFFSLTESDPTRERGQS
jgi:uncharacterized protein (TIGR02147 family)